jgi:tRNA pseudouridine38-40 synthase
LANLQRNLKLTLAYDGSEFSGWQVQPDRPTIQGLLSEAIEKVTKDQVLPQGSGRTDAGVHALAQVATFSTDSTIPTENLVRALNSLLPDSIRVTNAEEVAQDFHARHSAKAKTYEYRIYRGSIVPPFVARYVYHHPFPIDEKAMVSTADVVVGEHDFTSFAAVDPDKTRQAAEQGGEDAPSMVRAIFESTWERRGDEFVYRVRGNGFLHHMVRNLVGTFLLVGKGTLSRVEFKRIIEARDRSAAGATAPASGLFLVSVEY